MPSASSETFDGKSLAETIAAYAPAARVVKAFNICNAVVWQMEPPLFDGRRLVVLYCGDDAAAKQKVATLIENTGGEPADLGAEVCPAARAGRRNRDQVHFGRARPPHGAEPDSAGSE